VPPAINNARFISYPRFGKSPSRRSTTPIQTNQPELFLRTPAMPP
jgi:hypothetical protein